MGGEGRERAVVVVTTQTGERTGGRRWEAGKLRRGGGEGRTWVCTAAVRFKKGRRTVGNEAQMVWGAEGAEVE